MGYARQSEINFFSASLSSRFEAPEREPGIEAHAEAQNWSWGELNQVSDFLQGIVRPRRPFRRVNQKQLPAVDAMKPDVFGVGRSLIGARL